MVDAPTRDGAASVDQTHIENEALRARVKLLLLIASSGWILYGMQDVVGGRRLGFLHTAVGAVILLVRLGATPSATRKRLETLVHVAATVSLIGLIGLGLVTGQESSPAGWFFASLPIFAIYTLSVRAMVVWLVLGGCGLLVVHGSALFVHVPPLAVTPSYELLVAQLALGTLVLSATIAVRRTNERQIAILRERERVIRAQSEEIREQSHELKRAHDAAIEATRVKGEFLAMMSHEIRTPLNAVIGMATLLEGEEFAPEHREAIEAIRVNGEALLSLVTDVLDLSKLEADKLEIEVAPVDVARCVEGAIDQVAASAGAKGLELGYELSEGCPAVVLSDATRLRQILVNLLGNGVKFTKSGSVTVHALVRRTIGERVELAFEVRDTGIGIDEAHRHRLFQPFSQADASTTRKYGGTGLGLVISKKLCELLGGTIEVDGDVGRGATFRFTIIARPRTRGSRSELAPSGSRVLVVAEHPATAPLVVRHLARLAAESVVVSSREAALEHLRTSERFSCALFDLAGDDGEAAAFVHEARRARADLPIVVHARVRAAWADAERAHFLPKPLKASRLREALGVVAGEEPVPSRRAPSHATLPSSRPPNAARSVLVVDDNAMNRTVAVAMVQKLGCAARAVESGAVAIDAVRAEAFDVVLMDVQMPDMDGYAATKLIVEDPAIYPKPRIIAMTASAFAGDRERCLRAGMSDYVSKPVRPDALAKALGFAVAKTTEDEGSGITEVLDAKTLEGLRMLEATTGTELLADLARTFGEDTPKRIADLRAAVGAGDVESVKSGAHRLRGSAGALGAMRLFFTATELEDTAERGKLDGCDRLVDLLEKDAARAIDALERVVQRGAPKE